MRLANDLDGKPIISVSDGSIVGRAKGVYVDRNLEWLAGVDLGTEGIIRRKKVIVVRDDVVLFGLDVILVSGSDVVTDNKAFVDAKTWLRPKQISGREVITPGGTRIGTVGDVLFDEGGRVGGFTLSRVFVEGPLARKRVVLREAVLEPNDLEGNVTVDLLRLEALLAGREASLLEADGESPLSIAEQVPEDMAAEEPVAELAESQQDERDASAWDDEPSTAAVAADQTEAEAAVATMEEPYPAATMATKPEEDPLAVSDSDVVAETPAEAQAEEPPEASATSGVDEEESAAPLADEDESAQGQSR